MKIREFGVERRRDLYETRITGTERTNAQPVLEAGLEGLSRYLARVH